MLRRMAVLAIASIALAGCGEPMAPGSSDPTASAPEVMELAGSSSIGATCAPVPEGLVSWWRGEGDAQDVTGTNPGLIEGTVGFAPGMVGQGFSLSGNGYVEVADDPSLSFTDELSIEFWFEYPSASTFRGLVAKRDPNNPANGATNYGVSLNASFLGLGLYYNDLTAQGTGDDAKYGPYEAIRQMPAPSANVFHHFAGTYRQLATGVEVLMYVDGELVRGDTLGGTLANTVNTAPLTLGASTALGLEGFAGVLDEISLYRRALSPEEVRAIYEAGAAGKCTTAPLVPFASLSIDRAKIEFERGATRDRFDLWGRFELGPSSNGIAPLTEDVDITFGPVHQTIPAGSFARDDDDDGYIFNSHAPGIKQVQLRDNGVFRVRAAQVDLGDMPMSRKSSVTFGLGIGDDQGTAVVQLHKAPPRGRRDDRHEGYAKGHKR